MSWLLSGYYVGCQIRSSIKRMRRYNSVRSIWGQSFLLVGISMFRVVVPSLRQGRTKVREWATAVFTCELNCTYLIATISEMMKRWLSGSNQGLLFNWAERANPCHPCLICLCCVHLWIKVTISLANGEGTHRSWGNLHVGGGSNYI